MAQTKSKLKNTEQKQFLIKLYSLIHSASCNDWAEIAQVSQRTFMREVKRFETGKKEGSR